MKTRKRIFCLFLALIMCLSLLPITAFAEEQDIEEDVVQEIAEQVEEPADITELPTLANEPEISEPEEMADEPEIPEPEEVADEPVPVEVRFVLNPEQAALIVYTKDEQDEKQRIEPEEDGSYRLLPGMYFYSVFCDGFVPAEDIELIVTDRAEPAEVQVILQEADPEDTVTAQEVIVENTEEEEPDDNEAEIEIASSGSCGDSGSNLRYTLDSSGHLIISGTGTVKQFAFSNNTAIKKVTFEEGVTGIGINAFRNDTGITSVELPESLVYYYESCFSGCKGLKSIRFPSNTKLLDNWVLYECDSLISINIPYGVTSLGKGFCERCDNLEFVRIPDTVTSLGEWCMQCCPKMESITIPASVSRIDAHAFWACPGLTTIVFEHDHDDSLTLGDMVFHVDQESPLTDTKVLVPNANTINDTIAQYNWVGDNRNVSIGSEWSLSNITWKYGTGKDAGKLTISGKGDMPDIGRNGVPPWIDENHSKDSIKTVVIGADITYIGSYAFSDCRSLKTLSFAKGSKLKGFGEGAFQYCTSLSGELVLPNSVESIGSYAFGSCDALSKLIVNKDSKLEEIGPGCFSFCNSLKTINIQSSAGDILIRSKAFKGCDALSTVKLSEVVWRVDDDAFDDCPNLSALYLPLSLEEIGQNAFSTGKENGFVYYSGDYLDWGNVIKGSGNTYITQAINNGNFVYEYGVNSGIITNPANAHGSNYTTSNNLAEKLNAIFSGNLALYHNSKCTDPVIAPLGSKDLKNKGKAENGKWYYYVGAANKSAKNSGTSCWIYAQGVYYSLFGEVAFAKEKDRTKTRTDGKTSVSSNLIPKADKKQKLTYSNFLKWGVRNAPGAHIRSWSGHSMILLGYDTDGMTVLEGNGNGEGLVRITRKAWNKIKVDYIIQPKDEAYYNLYSDYDLKHYPAYAQLAVQKTVGIKDVPYNTANDIVVFHAGDTLAATEIVENMYGNYWYKVLYNGQEGYVYGGYNDNGETYVTASRNLGISIEDLKWPEAVHRQGQPISLTGKVASPYMPITEVRVNVLANKNNTGEGDGWKVVYDKTTCTDDVKNYQLSSAKAIKDLATSSKSFGTGLYQIDLAVTVSYYSLRFDTNGDIKIRNNTGTGEGYTSHIQFEIKNWVAYNANGGENAPETQYKEKGNDLKLTSTQPSRKGYRFTGWGEQVTKNKTKTAIMKYPVGGENIFKDEKNLTLYAIWEQVTGPVTATYNSNVGRSANGSRMLKSQAPIIADSEVPEPQTAEAGSEVFIPWLEPTREGYRFRGWSDRADGSGALYQPGQRYVLVDDIEFYAVWEAQSWPVTYDANGGDNPPAPQAKPLQTPLTLSDSIPTRDGYAFLGWTTSPDVHVPTFQPGELYEADSAVTLYAVWQPEGMYDVCYHANGGDGAPVNQTAEIGAELVLDADAPIRNGYEFLGWALTPDADHATYQPGGAVIGDNSIDLYAVWRLMQECSELCFDANGGEGAPFAQAGANGENITISENVPVRKGYTFLGWALNPASDTANYQPGDSFAMSGETLTLSALWAPQNITISYDANGGENAPGEDTIAYGDYYVISGEMPTKEDAVFLGWAESAAAKEPLYRPYGRFDGEDTVTLYAVWQEIVYTVSYDANGGEEEPLPQEKPSGETLYLSAAEPEHEQYEFLGWARDKNATEAEFAPSDEYTEDADLVLYAVWDGSWLTVNYDANGGENAPAPQTVTFWNDLIIPWETPTRKGFTFLGWSTDANSESADYVPGDLYEDDSDVTLYAVWTEGETWIELSQEYLVLSLRGKPAYIGATVFTQGEKPEIQWSVAGDEDAVAVTDDGVVYPIAEGTADIIASLEGPNGKPYASVRCRVDVVESEESDTPIADDVWNPENGVTLLDKAVTVELYRTDYARIRVIPNLSQNLNTAAVGDVMEQNPDLTGTGAAVTAAYFAEGSKAAELFDLRVVDDRTLEIVPKDSTLLLGQEKNGVKGSYSSEIKVVLEGPEEGEPNPEQIFSAGTLKMTVKKSLPKIKAAAVKLNSYIRDEKALAFTGGTVSEITATNKESFSEWLDIDEGSQVLTYKGAQNAKKSGKLKLMLKVEGWSIKTPLTISVSAAKTEPKLTFKPATLTVKPGTNDAAGTAVTVSPAVFQNPERYPIELAAENTITEGSGKKLKTYELGTMLQCSFDGNTLTVRPGPQLTDGSAHTFKLWLTVCGKRMAVTVKALATKSAVSLKLKTAGGIDLTVPNSAATITANTGNYHTDMADFAILDIVKAKTTQSVLDQFEIEPIDGNSFRLKAGSGLAAGSYTVKVQADCGGASAEKTINITVKQSAASKVKPSVTLKLSGKIDVLRPGTSVTVTPTIKNWYLHELSANDLVFYRKENKKFVEITDPTQIPFDVELREGRFILTQKAPINHKTETYGVGMRFNANEIPVNTAKPVAVSVTMGKAKLTQSVKSVQLLKRDKYSSGTITIRTGDSTLNGIDRVAFADSNRMVSKDGRFTVVNLGNGDYAIRYAGNTIPTNLKSATVKLKVYLEGNETAAPNATLSVKVNII